MKKHFSIILLVFFLLTLAGCSKTENTGTAVSSEPNKWGITLEAENITSLGLTIVCSQSGGENTAQLLTGSYYIIEKLEKSQWVAIPYVPQEFDVSWTMEAWAIPKNSTTPWDVNWEWLYGNLSAGQYRIGKEIMNFRDTGDYDTEMVYAAFVIH